MSTTVVLIPARSLESGARRRLLSREGHRTVVAGSREEAGPELVTELRALGTARVGRVATRTFVERAAQGLKQSLGIPS